MNGPASAGPFSFLDSPRAPLRPRHRRPCRPSDPRDAVRRRRGGRPGRLVRGAGARLVQAAARAAAREGPVRASAGAGGAARRARPRGLPDHGLRRAGGHRRPEREPRADGGLRALLGRRPVRVAVLRQRLRAAQPVARARPRDRLARGPLRGDAGAAGVPGAPRPHPRRGGDLRLRDLRAVLGERDRARSAGDPDAPVLRRDARGDEPLRRRGVDAQRGRVRRAVRADRLALPARPPRGRPALPPGPLHRRRAPDPGDRHDRAAGDLGRQHRVRRGEGGRAVQRPRPGPAVLLRRPRILARLLARARLRRRPRGRGRDRRDHLDAPACAG